MSPQKLLFCYHLPTRGRAGVKLGDAWYISNVSIIFDAPCLFIHHLLCVLLHFVAFLCIFRNYPTNETPSCQFPVFYCFCVSEKLHGKIFSELDETKAEPPIFPEHELESKVETEGATTWPHPRAVRAKHCPRHQGVSPPGPLPDAALPPIYSPRQEKPKGLINFPRNLLQATAVVDARSGGSRSSSRHPAGEGNHRRRPSSSPWSPLEWCVSSLP
jgi:hypothetical protein